MCRVRRRGFRRGKPLRQSPAEFADYGKESGLGLTRQDPGGSGEFHPPRGSTAARPLLFVCFWGQGAWALGDQGDVGHMDCVHGCIYIYRYISDGAVRREEHEAEIVA